MATELVLVTARLNSLCHGVNPRLPWKRLCCPSLHTRVLPWLLRPLPLRPRLSQRTKAFLSLLRHSLILHHQYQRLTYRNQYQHLTYRNQQQPSIFHRQRPPTMRHRHIGTKCRRTLTSQRTLFTVRRLCRVRIMRCPRHNRTHRLPQVPPEPVPVAWA